VPRRNNFRVYASAFLITWSQTHKDFDPELIVQHVHKIETSPKLNLAREKHKDGGTHFHAFVQFKEGFRTRNSKLFDVTDPAIPITQKANIQAVGRTPWLVYDYVEKDMDIIHREIERPVETKNSKESVRKATRDWDEIISQPTSTQYWQALKRLAPERLATNYNNLKSYALDKYKDEEAEDNMIPEGTVEVAEDAPQPLKDWMRDFTARHIEEGAPLDTYKTHNERYALLAHICLEDL
jgi:hypothetical protein